ncbi:MAG TPA: hypothetical protein VHU79_06685, partial [Sphingomicrobium sp.]|nr:hypothetical protein [Sphingomicrobium sp.]
MKNIANADRPKSATAMLPPRPLRGSEKVAQTACNSDKREGKSCIPTLNQTLADSRIPKISIFRTFRIAGGRLRNAGSESFSYLLALASSDGTEAEIAAPETCCRGAAHPNEVGIARAVGRGGHFMKIGIIGSGVVAKTLGAGFRKHGHEVELG